MKLQLAKEILLDMRDVRKHRKNLQLAKITA